MESPRLFFLVITSFGISLGVFWEIFEWVTMIPEVNPVVDIMMNSLGAATAATAWFRFLDVMADEAGGK